MKLKLANSIGGALVLIAVIAIGAYYFLPKDFLKFTDSAKNYFELTVLRDDLSAEDLAKYQEQFDLVVAQIQSNQDYVDPWFDLARIKKYVGDYRGSEAALIKAGEIRPNNSTSFTNLADLYANFLGEYDKAEIAYQTAIANSLGEWGNDKLYREYAYFVENHLKDPARATSILVDGLEDNPQSIDLMTVLADLYKRQGDVDNALKYYREALKIDPEDDAIRQEISNLQNAK
ncbi:MAG: tetratricopeptide repeat protein [Candidatus Buchananbacteria bacterium]|nr:tetratricopeptide repeat protein [Candidatus Buchananbacteria bacterium]